MSSEVAITIRDISKCYQIYDKPRDRLLQMISRGRRTYFREFWALRGVSFDVKRGETVGIVGRNGSGKSTLLQLICGTLNPSSGSIQTYGRIAALLELGSGFNPDFTGRENVYMNATVLGLSKEEIDLRFDDIAAFADIGEFIEQPVKTYSSGMQIRLAFSVAINVKPEILIVDEALSVGDELFQRKCFSRIESIRAAGATILFVSHSGGTVVELCDRAILLDSGEQLAIGTPKHIIGQYHKLLYSPDDKRNDIRNKIKSANHVQAKSLADGGRQPQEIKTEEPTGEKRETFDPHLKPSSTIEYESHGAYIESPRILTTDDIQVNNLVRGNTYIYIYTVRFADNASDVRFGMMIKTLSGVELGGAATSLIYEEDLKHVAQNSNIEVRFTFKCNLNAGVYFLNAGVTGNVSGAETYLHRLIDIGMFRVLPETDNLVTGIVDFNCQPNYKVLEI